MADAARGQGLCLIAFRSVRDDGRTERDALDSLDALVARFPQAIRDIGPTTGVRGRLLEAMDAQYAAEQARARGQAGEPLAWIRAVEACANAGLPFEEAYSSWRAAEALLGRGHDRQAGAGMLRRGLALARRLGAQPVERELVDLRPSGAGCRRRAVARGICAAGCPARPD